MIPLSCELLWLTLVLERWGMKEIEITRKLKQNSMKAGQKAPFFSLTCPFLPSEEVLASSLGLAHLDVCVFECGRVREPDGEEGCSTSNKERTGE